MNCSTSHTGEEADVDFPELVSLVRIFHMKGAGKIDTNMLEGMFEGHLLYWELRRAWLRKGGMV